MRWPWQPPKDGERDLSLTLEEYLGYFNYFGTTYASGLNQSLPGSKQEEIGADFRGLAEGAYKRNSVVFACLNVRMRLFSEARFQYRQMRGGRPGDLFGTADLGRLEKPWPNGTTGDLLKRAIQDADLAGNFFACQRRNGIKRMRPDWTTIVLGSNTDDEVTGDDLDADVLGYLYQPGGSAGGRDFEVYLVEEVAHWAPVPDPTARWRGMSLLTSVVREIQADSATTDHKQQFFEQGATPNMIVKFEPSVRKDQFDAAVAAIKAGHEGRGNAYKTLFLGGGADAQVVGSTLEQMDFKNTQGAGETRIAAAMGVPPVIVGLSEGLAAATYSNYGQARRAFADLTMRPLWRDIAGSLATIVNVPDGADLWYDDRDIPFLQEDLQDEAEIQQKQAGAIKQLVDAGFDAASVVDAVMADDYKRLTHTGLFSVQLQPPGTVLTPPANGNGVVAPALAEQP